MSMTKDNLKIGQEEFNRTKIATLSDRPNVGSAVGGNALSAAQMKKRYDASAELIVQRFNALIDALAGFDEYGSPTGGVADLIQTGLGENYSLANLFAGLSTGEAAQRIRVGIEKYSLKGFLEMVLGALDDKLEAAQVDVAVLGLEHGQEPTVSWKVTGAGEDKRVLLTFAIPEGKAGKDGKDGKDGSSGVYVGSGPMPEDCCIKVDPGEETCDPVTVRYAFVVGTEDEDAYLVSNTGVWNESGGYRYHDKGAASIWRYPIENAASVSSALWHGHTSQQTLLQASVDGKSWAVLIDNGSKKKGHQDYIEICDYVDIAASGTSWLYICIGDSNAVDGGGGAILNDMPVTMDITCGLISPDTLPEVSEADNGKWLRVVNGQWRKVGGENVVSRVQNYNFTVGEADENEHLTGEWGTLNANHRYADNDAKITYHYHLANSSQIRGLVWSAECGNQIHIEVSYDGKTWQDVLNAKEEKLNFERRIFDLMPYMGNRGLLCYDELYIRIGDSNYDQSNTATHDSYGGALSRGTVVELRTERFELPFGF